MSERAGLLLRPRLWIGAPSVLVGVAVGYFTNLVTGDEVTWPVVVGFGAAVAVGVVLTVLAAGRAERERLAVARRSRAVVLPALSAPALSPDEGHSLSSLLSPAYALSAFRGRGEQHRALVRWCAGDAGSRVHLLAGASGVGKTRLMVEVANALPDGWMAGRVADGAARGVLDAVLAAAEPTLIVLDDADTRMPEAVNLVRRVSAEGPFDPPVKLVLVVRDADGFDRLLRDSAPDELVVARRSVTLDVIGGERDRRRWFAEAIRAYAAALKADPPPVSELDERPVGGDEEPMVVTQTRAALAALDGTAAAAVRLRSAPLDELADEIAHHERQRWRSILKDSSLGLPAWFTVQACEDAVLSLILFAPATMQEASAALPACPRFKQLDEGEARNIVDAVCRLYPGEPALPVTATPDFLLGTLLARAAVAADQGTIDLSGLAAAGAQRPEVIRRLLRATHAFPSVLPLVTRALDLGEDKLVPAAEALVLTGSVPRAVEHVLATAIQRGDLTVAHAERLLTLIGAHGWGQVRVALHRVLVAHARTASTTDPWGRWASGEWREALVIGRESVGLWRELVSAEPAAHTANLAIALTNLARQMCQTGDHDDELRLRAEAVARFARLAKHHPEEAEDRYRRARSDFAQQCSQHDREPTFALQAEQQALQALADNGDRSNRDNVPSGNGEVT